MASSAVAAVPPNVIKARPANECRQLLSQAFIDFSPEFTGVLERAHVVPKMTADTATVEAKTKSDRRHAAGG